MTEVQRERKTWYALVFFSSVACVSRNGWICQLCGYNDFLFGG